MTGTEKIPSEITDFKENHTDTTVSFTVTSTKDKIDSFEKAKGGLLGKFKLSTTISTKNMTLFDDQGKIHRYKTSLDILRTFFDHRLEFYVKRKAMLLEKMRRELAILENKARFVEEVCNEDLVVSNRKRKDLLHDLKDRGYDLFPKDEKLKTDEDDEDTEKDDFDESASDAELAKGYEYLLGMKIWSLTHERAEELRRQFSEKTKEVEKLQETPPKDIWSNDLDAIEDALGERDEDIASELKKEATAQNRNKSRARKVMAKTAKKAKKSKKKVDDWDSELEDSDSDEDFVVSKPLPRKKAPVKKKAPAKKPPAPKVKPAPSHKSPPTESVAATDNVLSSLENLSIDEPSSPEKEAPAPSNKSSAVEDALSSLEILSISDGEAPAPKPKTKTAPKPKAPAKKAAPTKKRPSKKYDSDSDDFSDSDGEVVLSPVAPRARSSRRQERVVYAVDSDSEDDDSDFEFE